MQVLFRDSASAATFSYLVCAHSPLPHYTWPERKEDEAPHHLLSVLHMASEWPPLLPAANCSASPLFPPKCYSHHDWEQLLYLCDCNSANFNWNHSLSVDANAALSHVPDASEVIAPAYLEGATAGMIPIPFQLERKHVHHCKSERSLTVMDKVILLLRKFLSGWFRYKVGMLQLPD